MRSCNSVTYDENDYFSERLKDMLTNYYSLADSCVRSKLNTNHQRHCESVKTVLVLTTGACTVVP